ncbi:type II toxin-antitoxin system VapC family toxin [Acinetobacter bereziniae]|uniref:type II toxin-antitoxin system VapC family toxin n=1 Tax=Acinetobacter bereziniae TaxID=106648 RepID=UPI001250C88B|nr:type II toxin-antitoxin system VapC family toxin [Acinetobacter bereziniae]
MIITIDANILIALFDDYAFDKGFVQFCLANNVQQVIIPTPAMCEFLSRDSADRFQFIQNKKRIATIVNFDEKSAYITANIAEVYYKNKLEIPRQKVKVDLQILGIAISNGSSFILTRDNDFKSYINHLNLKIGIKNISDLQITDDFFNQN